MLITNNGQYLELCSRIKRLRADETIALDTETTGVALWTNDVLRGVCVGFRGESFYVPVSHPDSPNVWSTEPLRNALTECAALPVYANAPFDWRSLEAGIGYAPPMERYRDVQVISWLIDENAPKALKKMGARFFGEDEAAEQRAIKAMMRPETKADAYRRGREAGLSVPDAKAVEPIPGKTWASFTAEDIAEYAAHDADLTDRVYRHLLNSPEYGTVEPAVQRQHDVQAAAYRMTRRGIGVDADKADRLQDAALAQAARIAAEFDVSIASAPQLATLIYETWGLPVTETTDGGKPSTAAAVLEAMAGEHAGLDRILEYRRLVKAAQFYAGLLEHVDQDGRVHPGFSVVGTVTGRWTCREPNLQQIPKESTNPDAKKLFVARPGYELVGFDLKSAELFVAASLAADEEMMAALSEEGRSFHKETAQSVFGSEVEPFYTLAKNLNYGCVSPDMRVLTADLRWVEAGGLAAGDPVIGFDEHGPWRRFKYATVTSNEIGLLPSVRIEFQDGSSVDVSDNHPWLVRTFRGVQTLRWRRPDQLRPGDQIPSVLPVWDTDQSREGGYLAGILDGEGCLTFTAQALSLQWAQRPGDVLDRSVAAAGALGFQVARYAKGGTSDVISAKVLGGRDAAVQLLGTVRPSRLLGKFEPAHLGLVRGRSYRTVVRVTPIGLRPMAMLGTSCATYVADGLPAHNTPYGIGPKKFATYIAKGRKEVQTAVHYREAKEALDRHRKQWPALHRAIRNCTEYADLTGRLPLGWPGRFRHFVSPTMSYPVPGYHAFNSAVQSGVAHFMNDVLLSFEAPAAEIGAVPLLAVHDNLVLETPIGTMEAVHSLIQRVADDVNPFRMRMLWDMKSGV